MAHIPARAACHSSARFAPIDLRRHLNEALDGFGLTRTMGATNSTAPLHTLGGVEFEMCGYILLKLGDLDPAFPPRASGIAVGQNCRVLHFLHSCDVRTNCVDGTLVGSYVVHYAEGGQEEIPIVYSQNVRYWEDTQNLLGRASEVWLGTNDNGDFVRLIKCSWQNPRPESEVQTVDFVANRTDAHPILFAITAAE